MTPIEEVRNLLAAANSEAQYRTVASRAYYAAFAEVITLAGPLGFVPTGSGADHSRLAQFLAGHTNPLLQRIGRYRLPRLRKLRNRADYDLQVSFTRGLAEEAARTAEEVIAWIAAIAPPSPAGGP
jgi:uncharacterized protein (UPF0332 family)